jgi:hypothetical protein
MWARLDDELLDHPKVWAAGEVLGKGGAVIALGIYVIGLMWANKYLTDGHLPMAVVKNFRQWPDPLSVADALVKAGLWEKNGNGFVIHDYAAFGNPMSADVKAKRRKDRQRKAMERAR